MRHKVKKTKLNMAPDRKALLIRNLVTDLFLHGKIKTTTKRAKMTQQKAEKIITFAKTHTEMQTIRELKSFLLSEVASKRIIQEFLPKYKEQNSGFVRLINGGFRKGDSAEISYIELI